MRGIFLLNGFYKSKSFDDIYVSLEAAANKNGVELLLKKNTELLAALDESSDTIKNDIDFAIIWNKDVTLARALEKNGIRCFNSSKAIELCDNKALTHIALMDEIKMPRTYHIPQSYTYIGYNDMSFLNMYEEVLNYPYILKECNGSFGSGVHMINKRADAERIIKECGVQSYIVQEFIEPMGNEYSDIRAYMVGDECVAAIERYSLDDFRVNINNGGSARKYELTNEEKAICIKAAKLLGLDFCGVDLLHSKDGVLLCEVNSSAQFEALREVSGKEPSEMIIEHILKELRDNE